VAVIYLGQVLFFIGEFAFIRANSRAVDCIVAALAGFADFWSAPAFEDGAFNGDIAKLPIFAGAPKKQASAAHVSAPDKVLRKYQLFSETAEQNVAILSGCDTAEENGLTAAGQFTSERIRIVAQRV
jgi:hypothetical protein